MLQDQLVYRKSVDVVWEWLRRYTDDLDESVLEKYANINLVELYNRDREEEMDLIAMRKNAADGQDNQALVGN